jgi:hypothetical protein
MFIAGNFIADVQHDQRVGPVSCETEQHFKHEFRARHAQVVILSVTDDENE